MNGRVITCSSVVSIVCLGVVFGVSSLPVEGADGHGASGPTTGEVAKIAVGVGRLQPESSSAFEIVTPTPTAGAIAGITCAQPGDNCQQQNPFDALASDRARFVLAEDFTPAADSSVSSLCWWGAYGKPNLAGGFDDCQGLNPDTFEITYFENVGGLPGAVVASFSQQAGTLNVAGPTGTGTMIAGALPEYAFSATHAAVPLTAGQCYWVVISNLPAADCYWFWELGATGNGHVIQDGDGVNSPDGFSLGEAMEVDMALCLDVALGDSTACVPPRPTNDDCIDADPITGTGYFAYDNESATTDGTRVASCYPSSNVELQSDVWYCWTAPCTDTVLVSSCATATADSLIAVYDGCGTCPPGGADLLTCNDDRCGDDLAPRQSMAVFPAVAGQSYLIRVGTFPFELRQAGGIEISCGPPDNTACVPGTGDCCSDAGTGSPACGDELCCELVCACDPYCCEVEWDDNCATFGFQSSGCGAALLCQDRCDPCGNPESGDCCSNNGTRGCADATCCANVCACDPFCCDVVWDDNCATFGYEGSGCGAAALCGDLCVPPVCPSGEVVFVDPPNGVVDARQPHPPADATTAQGISILSVIAPAGAEARCFTLCETANTGAPNEITRVSGSSGAYNLRLARAITPGAVTTLTYTDNAGLATTATFTSHPGNINGDSTISPIDVLTLTNVITGAGSALPWGLYSGDIDHSGGISPSDILRVIDLFNGGDLFDPTFNTPRPTAGGVCP